MRRIPPLRREVIVAAPPEIAFEVFTREIGAWWPLDRLGVFHDGTVAFAGGRLVEYSAAGEESVWGIVTGWEPPSSLSFTWHPGQEEAAASRVTVAFRASDDGDGTLVTLVHEGWEALADPAAAREEYGRGWPGVLDGYAASVASAGGATWVVLHHRAAAGVAGPVFADPRFAGHAAFLQRMAAVGYLVAAGPVDPARGEGMTILRLPGAGRLEEARRLAEGDRSVAEGLLSLELRPWHVRSSAIPDPRRAGAGSR